MQAKFIELCEDICNCARHVLEIYSDEYMDAIYHVEYVTRGSAVPNTAILDSTKNADGISSEKHRQNNEEEIMPLHRSNCGNDDLPLLLSHLWRFSNSRHISQDDSRRGLFCE